MSKIGRPRKGKEVALKTSIRLEPRIKSQIIKRCGSVQEWIDTKILADPNIKR